MTRTGIHASLSVGNSSTPRCQTRCRAREGARHTLHLHSHSPDPNLIKHAWKDLKRELGAILNYDKAIQEAEGKALQLISLRKKQYSKK